MLHSQWIKRKRRSNPAENPLVNADPAGCHIVLTKILLFIQIFMEIGYVGKYRYQLLCSRGAKCDHLQVLMTPNPRGTIQKHAALQIGLDFLCSSVS